MDVAAHYRTVRKHAVLTDGSLYSCGWLLDIARGLYTLRTGRVIAKTTAGEWALREGLCPVPETLRQALNVRKQPLLYKDDEDFRCWAATLGEEVQRFADVLERELTRTNKTI